MLISTAQLASALHDPTWAIFDCRHDLMDFGRGALRYAEEHIPGAHFAPVETALSGEKNGTNGRHPLPAPEAFAAFLARHGVTATTQIVAYDEVGGLYAARLWWLARWIGLARVALLDGGFSKWVGEQRPLSRATPTPRAGTLQAKPIPTLTWSAADVERRLNDPAAALLDARPAERYRGEVEPIDPVAGRIPGASNRFYKTNLNPDLTFRAPGELKREFEQLLGGRQPGNVGHQCGSGVTACANIFAMEYAGLPGSKLYPGSWSEWISDPRRPIAKG